MNHSAPLSIRTCLLHELEAILVSEMGEKAFRAGQIMRWVFAEQVECWDQMTNISKALRTRLATRFALPSLPSPTQHIASDGTNKIAFALADGAIVESVLIPTPERLTLCVSSQVGCRYNCAFCRTATLGFKRHLSADEILAQVLVAGRIAAATHRRITNLVFMGMGEPFDNYDNLVRALRILLAPEAFDFSKRKITLSTVGHVPGLLALARESLGVNLAISLHAASDELRSQIMPANRLWPLDELFNTLRRFPLQPRQRFTFEYLILKDVNHGPHDANLLVKRLHAIPSKVNLIGFNAFEGCRFESPSHDDILEFQERLLAKGLATSVRMSRGGDELAACGLLGQKEPRPNA
ncbi:MAG: 23S rRNA (adenine(2503)-C(2))-methyltransferase RlmN [Proteobacteria bacterium]|nr:23S rRNA (adenine(2503)-C(2))-methyltransferase RlmN [Pseudomonadota bacterium]